MSQGELTGLLRDIHALASSNQGVQEELAQWNRERREWEQRNMEIQEANLTATQNLNITMDEVLRQVSGSGVSGHAATQRHRVSSAEPPRLHPVTAEDAYAVEDSEHDAQEEGSGDGSEEPMDVEPKD